MDDDILRIELARRKVDYGNHEIGLFVLVYKDTLKVWEFVTWAIVDENTLNGHYTNRLYAALEDYMKRH